ncbi:MAG: sulfite exporter TauE/SafE family protein [Pyrinomonadaceae bacterium]
MQQQLIHGLVLCAAAFAAGMINSVAGGGTLLTFPALLWIGLDPKMANATSTVALWPGLIGGLFGFRREMAENRPLLLRLGLTSVIGGAIGAELLILTPSPTFARLVPFLILFATVLFTLQEPVTRLLRLQPVSADARRSWWAGAILFQFCSAIYGGYFGAGNGILMLAAMGLLGITDIHRANGLKNYLGMCLNCAAVIGFAWKGLVAWPLALLMMGGAVAGGFYGASAARRVGRTIMRRVVIIIGLLIGSVMLWRMWQ